MMGPLDFEVLGSRLSLYLDGLQTWKVRNTPRVAGFISENQKTSFPNLPFWEPTLPLSPTPSYTSICPHLFPPRETSVQQHVPRQKGSHHKPNCSGTKHQAYLERGCSTA